MDDSKDVYSEEQDNNSEELSKYNEAGLQISRLHELWLLAEQHISRGHFLKWKFTLDAIWREMNADVERMNDVEEVRKKDRKLKLNIARAKTRSDYYNALDERHQSLKVLQDNAGKGGVYIDPKSDDID